MRLLIGLGLIAVLFLASEVAQAQQKKFKDADVATKRQMINEGALAGKCKYDRCYNKCMVRRGYDQWGNAKCAERCSRVLGCV